MQLPSRIFNAFHQRTLIYNACCEDPAIDRVALQLHPNDRLLVVTSGGCNALDYLLGGAGEVNCVDVNPCQNSLLEFKIAAIQSLEYSDVWALFGEGRAAHIQAMYHDAIEHRLSPPARRFWGRRLYMFRGSYARPSFYSHGGWGVVMWLLRCLWGIRRLGPSLEALFQTSSLAEQWELYASKIRARLLPTGLLWVLSRAPVHALLGIPPRQRRFILEYPGGLYKYAVALLDDLVATIPFSTNYFMRANLLGSYSKQCCPEYLTPAGWQRLKDGLLDRLTMHTLTVTNYLRQTANGISKFILLDHMDWLTGQELTEEWMALFARAAPGATAIFRSALHEVDYLNDLWIEANGQRRPLGELLVYQRELAARLHRLDRVHLYGSLSIATLP